uniref:RNA helicase aquarius n=1 Tax=Dendroctonus ponderosae TaxID=77166 RepID=A0AAR5QCQ0_DENPD
MRVDFIIIRNYSATYIQYCGLIMPVHRKTRLCIAIPGIYRRLLEMLKFYTRFEISDETGDPLSDHDMTQLHYIKITSLQKAAFAKFPELRAFSLANVANVDTRKALEKHFGPLSCDQLKAIATYLCLVPPAGQEENYKWCRLDESFLRELLVSRHEKRVSQLVALNEMPLYPTEAIIWDENIVPTAYFSGEGCLALPKLNMQFLTLHDYLLRNFNLFRLESTYEIRQDIEDAVSRLCPWKAEDGSTYWGGWARMAHPIEHFAVVEVAKPNIGETRPSRVRADVTVNLSVKSEVKVEWENLRKHDVCFLVTVKPLNPIGTRYNYKEPFVPQVGLRCVRGCEIEGMLDSNGRVIEDGPDPKPVLPGDRRTFRVWLDCNQYREDMSEANKGKDDVYEGFNIIIRRKPKENNFKAVLETIRELMNTECVVPEWLHNIILGYGDPSAAHYEKMEGQISTLDYNDTFIDADHLRSCFPEYQIKIKTDDPKKLVRPFRLTFENLGSQPAEEKAKIIVVEPHKIDRRGPFLFNEPKKNIIPFTPSQVEAIKSGMQPGLTLVVGPPGTGKTDVAVQIISNLYHNFPNQRTLIVTHSNQALNQLFDKIVSLDIDERHLLRLGHGEEALETEKDFSRYGRVNYVLAKRIDLLNEVQKLQESLDVEGDQAYTCETAGYFYLYQILSRWEHFQSIVKPKSGNGVPVEAISKEFPFHRFFNNAPQPLFQGVSYEADLEVAESCFRYIDHIFKELEEFRAFELLRSGLDRSKYLLVKEAKIIAMTCTHAALKRKELVEIGFKYDNILMEESAQILEIETFIPLLLQNPQDGYNRLKRWIMIGDHHQLPPVIKNMAFQKYSNMEQSLFTRLVRLGVPTVDLDGQGRARPSICNLYKWRYKQLGNLGHVENWPEYKRANAGFAFDFQLIDVQDFNGVGESEPNPYFYQNLAEAEYCVAVFMFMRLIGYPASKITILTTYNGQKHLIRDVINARCAKNPLIGRPHKVTTVDKYQGQQNDYILLSLVKTNAVGHLRDVRRLVVAMSRARLGLYIFARVALFQNCFELTPAFEQLTTRPTKLHLVLNELYPTHRLSNEKPDNQIMVVEDMTHIANFVYQYYMERVKVMRTQYEDTQKQFQEPGSLEQKSHDGLIASHPGEERDTDSEDEQEATGQLPIPIQDEVQPPKESPMEIIPVEQPDDDMKDETTASETMDTGEVANDE